MGAQNAADHTWFEDHGTGQEAARPVARPTTARAGKRIATFFIKKISVQLFLPPNSLPCIPLCPVGSHCTFRPVELSSPYAFFFSYRKQHACCLKKKRLYGERKTKKTKQKCHTAPKRKEKRRRNCCTWLNGSCHQAFPVPEEISHSARPFVGF